ncbi:DUF3592 domain-containing protein [Alteraurantiacibacter buctensis]|uniref:DUF3592 domain-containing protein n=1 Tax=Alteraurantiacibacter buctensis TaxID=1503981 RepID=A0A844YUT3_9SPHN|nr:DUF3592 domain-containing protein [Alteraurantiacibacter buctensis]MXO71319.1 DUF3592 domain-containing protein [Alteraurantiacibacter buctensis]
MNKWVWAVLALVVVAGIGILIKQDMDYEAALTGQTTATITRTELITGAGDDDSESTHVYYSFAANGQQWEEFSILDDNQTAQFTAGQQYPLCYNPEDPSQTRLALQLGGQCPAAGG